MFKVAAIPAASAGYWNDFRLHLTAFVVRWFVIGEHLKLRALDLGFLRVIFVYVFEAESCTCSSDALSADILTPFTICSLFITIIGMYISVCISYKWILKIRLNEMKIRCNAWPWWIVYVTFNFEEMFGYYLLTRGHAPGSRGWGVLQHPLEIIRTPSKFFFDHI